MIEIAPSFEEGFSKTREIVNHGQKMNLAENTRLQTTIKTPRDSMHDLDGDVWNWLKPPVLSRLWKRSMRNCVCGSENCRTNK
jgi:hypothetical protein